MALHKKHKRLLAYTAILGGCAILALTLFTVSQYEKAKCKAAEDTYLQCKTEYQDTKDKYLMEKGLDTVEDEVFVNDETSQYHDLALYWNEVYQHFDHVVKENAVAYKATCIPAYVFSMSTLVAFGLILKHAETAKEKEDEEEVLRQGKK